MERPEDFEEREESPAEANAEIAETVADSDDNPARRERQEGRDDAAGGVSGAENSPDI